MNILFVNAMGYGNIGDDTYPAIFKRHYKDNHKLFFMNSDEKPIPGNIDLLVMGGGGLIFDKPGEQHLEYMKRYMDYAISNNIPFGFISVGIQCRKKGGSWDHHSYAKRWVYYFRKCSFASFRDKLSLDYMKSRTGRNDFLLAPDLCYLFKEHKSYESEKYLVVIPGAKINTSNKQVLEIIDQHEELVFMNMGGKGTDQTTIDFKKKYPEGKVYYSKDLFPSLAFKIISGAKLVVTGRYHGMIYSRIANKPYWINSPSQYKLEVEDTSMDMSLAVNHLKLLDKFIR